MSRSGSRCCSLGADPPWNRRDRGEGCRSRRSPRALTAPGPNARLCHGVPCDRGVRRRLDRFRQGRCRRAHERIPPRRAAFLSSSRRTVHAEAARLRRRGPAPARARGLEQFALAAVLGRGSDRGGSGDAVGLCSSSWLDESLRVLRDAAESAPVDGEALLHLDVRSDNICLRPRRCARRLELRPPRQSRPRPRCVATVIAPEGGPPPEELLPAAGGHAAMLAGFWGARAGLPPPPTAPEVRKIQRAQLEVSLAWACRELELRQLDA